MHRFVVLSALLAVASASIIKPHIIGGEETTIEQHPYQASITKNGEHHCGAVIVTEKHVLSTAQCILVGKQFGGILGGDDGPVSQYKVIVGSTYRSKGQVHDVKETEIHPNFSWSTGRYALNFNIGVATLVQPIVFNAFAQPIAFVASNQVPQAGQMATVSGWGVLEGEEEPTNALHAVRVPIIDNEECLKQVKSYISSIDDEMLCAGKEGLKETPGDFGGPLVNDRKELMGIASFGIPKYYMQTPSLYVNLASRPIRRFIFGIIRDY